MVALPVIVAGTIGNYSDLLAKVGYWLDRDDLDARIPDFVALLEARLNRELRTIDQEYRTSQTGSGETFTFPADCKRLKRLWVDGADYDTPLLEISAQDAVDRFMGLTGYPTHYYVENRVAYFRPVPDDTYTINIVYFQKIDPLTSDNDSNWILEAHPDIYLMGTLLEAAIYIRDADAISFLAPRVEQTLADIKRSLRSDRWGGGPIAPRTIAQVSRVRC